MSEDLGMQVRLILLKKGITQSWLAKQLGISQAYLSDIIAGKRDGDKAQEHVKAIKRMLEIK